jgi:hypothetical protein
MFGREGKTREGGKRGCRRVLKETKKKKVKKGDRQQGWKRQKASG